MKPCPECVDEEIGRRMLFCKDFDLTCFSLLDPQRCKQGVSVYLGGRVYFTQPIRSICPLSDPIPDDSLS